MSTDRLVYQGKSKDVYEITTGEHTGKYRLLFTDRATGYMENGQPVFDPGRDVVVGESPGKGAIACRFATHFFRILKSRGIATHYIDTPADNEMIVEPADALGMEAQDPSLEGAAPLQNFEFTFRHNCTGSFWRRYPFVKPGKNLGCLVEAWTKGDVDTLITFESIEASGALSKTDIDSCVNLTKEVAAIVEAEFAAHDLHVLDGKFELGRLRQGDGSIVLIDEISPDVLRVCKNYQADANGDWDNYRQFTTTRFSNGKRAIKHSNQVSAQEMIALFAG